VEARYRHLPEDDGILAIIRDISAQKCTEERLAEANAKFAEANQVLRNLAHRDGLTGVANRRGFDVALVRALRAACRRRCPLGLVLFDIDHFKTYNDQYGHVAGDACLRRVAYAARRAARRPDDVVARYGGEEFAVLLPESGLDGAIEAGDHIRRCIAALRIEHRGSPYGIVTVSVGASSVVPSPPDRDPVPLVDAADRALYRAKAEGRNRVCGLAPQREPA
jgi:diguanylate cyclase (GGDEF)-like protein